MKENKKIEDIACLIILIDCEIALKDLFILIDRGIALKEVPTPGSEAVSIVAHGSE